MVLAVALLLIASACGSSSKTSPAATPAGSQAGYPVSFVNGDGSTTVIKAKPTRVVVVGVPYSYPGTVLGAGGHVVGAQPYRPPDLGLNPTTGFPVWLPDTRGITNVGDFGGATTAGENYETITGLASDLIVAQSTLQPGDLANLRKIAPVVTLPPASPSGIEWESALQKLGPMFGTTARSQAVIDRVNQRARALTGFSNGDTVTQIVPAGVGGGADFQQSVASNSEHFLALAGFKILPLLAARVDTGIGGNSAQQAYYSTEYLSKVVANYVILENNSTEQQQYSALPAYKAIPATDKIVTVGPEAGFADPYDSLGEIATFAHSLLGVTPLEATVGTGIPAVVDVDVEDSSGKVCWDSTSGSLNPGSIDLEQGSARVAALGAGASPSGCQQISVATAQRLAQTPAQFSVVVRSSGGAKLGSSPLAVQGTQLVGLPTA